MGILGTIENDVEVKEEKNPIEGTKSTNLVETTEKQQDNKEQKTIVMDGPLSTIYTKALNVVFSKDRDHVSIETQQMDAVLVADAHEWAKKKEKLKQEDMDKAAYVYVTTDDIVSQQPAETFDNLRIALDMERQGEKVICIECNDEVKLQKINTIVNYVENHSSQPKVFFNRSKLIDYLSK